MFKRVLLVLMLVAVAAVAIWATDQITMEGERTIYTVRCDGGSWEGLRCTGRMVAGDRYRFRASKARNEVIFWIAGSNEPSGKFSDCMVKDRGNWTCNMTVGQKASIAYEMIDSKPTRGGMGLTIPFHSVPKWKWWVIRMGVPAFSVAGY